MRKDREIVLSEEEIQNICNDIGAKLTKENMVNFSPEMMAQKYLALYEKLSEETA